MIPENPVIEGFKESIEEMKHAEALAQFEVELGMRSPETTRIPEAQKELGPAVEPKAAETTRN